ncbi:MAG TPA: sulfite oxidase [Tepidisphaeraceae bacterium]|nr:sulfite oxidase [Tepidisphaeraceae bacterium]
MLTHPTRRSVLRNGLLAAGAVSLSGVDLSALAAGDGEGEVALPFLEPMEVNPGKPMVNWDTLKDWITPKDDLYAVSHYGMTKVPVEGYELEIGGLVEKPRKLSLDDIKALPKKSVTATLECSGNGAGKTFLGAIGNVTWTGTPLAPLLKECGILPKAVEAAFWGADHKVEKIRGNDFDQNFARTLSIADASRDDLLLAYEMNGQPLSPGHGFPLRLIVPGWYGIAWVKWLSRIELRDRRLMNRFMARDYVTIRGEELPGGKVAWKESSVGPMNIKSFVARVVKRKDGTLVISGAAWSGMSPVKGVEVKIDNGEWQKADVDTAHTEPYTWRFWTYAWKDAAAGEHTIVSRAIAADGTIQPAADDPAIALKKTYWEANEQWPRKIKVGG